MDASLGERVTCQVEDIPGLSVLISGRDIAADARVEAYKYRRKLSGKTWTLEVARVSVT